LNLLDELTLPFVKVGGHFLALKGSDGKKELAEAEKGILFLGGSVSDVESFELSDAGGRVLIELEKRAPTPPKYPRAFGKIKKNPL
jgi:16S rRNA (guanine527-N7)-methyltransferase